MRFVRFYLVLGFVLGAAMAWAVNALADDRIRVMIIDTGIDAGHSALRDVICPDSDHFNAVTNKPGIPIDEHGHGTHVAGIIRALAGDKGYCLATCKYYSDANPGSINLRNSVKCFQFAAKVGATIVNYSGGGPEFSEDEYLAIRSMPEAQFFFAAGNEHQNVDFGENQYYPMSYRVPNSVGVGAIDVRGKRAAASNWGKSVKIELPGENIISSLPGRDRIGYMSGTSQATAVATGVALRVRFGLPAIGTNQAYYTYLTEFWKGLSVGPKRPTE